MRTTKNVEKVLLAYEKGYRVKADGSVWGPRGPRKIFYKKKRYYAFTVYISPGQRAPVLVHLLAAYQKFGGAALEAGIEVRHLNGDSSDNQESNLDIGTRSDNEMDKPEETRRATARKAAREAARALRAFTDEQVTKIRAAHTDGCTGQDLAEKYGVAKSTISNIVRNVTYK